MTFGSGEERSHSFGHCCGSWRACQAKVDICPTQQRKKGTDIERKIDWRTWKLEREDDKIIFPPILMVTNISIVLFSLSLEIRNFWVFNRYFLLKPHELKVKRVWTLLMGHLIYAKRHVHRNTRSLTVIECVSTISLTTFTQALYNALYRALPFA